MIRLPSNLSALRAAWRASENIGATDTPVFRIENAASSTRLYVNGIIGGYESDSAEFVQAVHGITSTTIDLDINSSGGFVYDAVSMYEALKGHSATVNVHVTGLAASAASFLAMAGDSVDVAQAGRLMIHDAQGIGIGSPADMREYADLLDAVSNDIAGIYAGRAGGTPASWRKAMSATTWYSASEAVGAGLVDRVTGAKDSGPDNRTRLIQARQRALATPGGVK